MLHRQASRSVPLGTYMAKEKNVNSTMMVICPPLIVWEPSWSRPRPWLVLLATHFRGPKDLFAESMSINDFVRPSSEQKKCKVYVAVASWYFQGFPLSYIKLTSRTSHNAFGWWRTVSWCRSVCWRCIRWITEPEISNKVGVLLYSHINKQPIFPK